MKYANDFLKSNCIFKLDFRKYKIRKVSDMNIIILYGGKSPEREVSQQSAKLIEDSLEKIGHKVISLELIGTYKIKGTSKNVWKEV